MKKSQSYKDLEVYSLAIQLVVKLHRITIKELPKFEMFEEGGQIGRSSKSIAANIVEGFGKRRYKNEFIRFLTYAITSCDETKAHLEILHDTGSIRKDSFDKIPRDYEELGAKLYSFRAAVKKNHRIS